MSVPSYVVDAAAAAVRAAATEIGMPATLDLSARAAALVHDPAALAAALAAAIAEVADDRLASMATAGLTLLAVPLTTANRRIQARNQAALVDLVRGLATVRLAERTGQRRFIDRAGAVEARDAVGEALDDRAALADSAAFAALRALRSAVVNHVADAVRDLPAVLEATPAAVLPALVVAYDIYDDIGRADEIAARNRLARPGFVPTRPIEVLSS